MDQDHAPVTLEVNGRQTTVEVDPTAHLMHVLRNDLGLKGVRTGCSVGECGACTVIIDGEAARSCLTPVSELSGARVTTPEGLGGPDTPHPVQQAFLDEQAAQCGYCINGMIMTVAAHLQTNPASDGTVWRDALDELLCRCGTHDRILRACRRAAGLPNEATHAIVAGRTDDGRSSDATDVRADALEVPQSVHDEPGIERWLTVTDDGCVLVHPGKVELGQGIRLAFTQIVASQLGISIDRVRVAPTVTGRSPDQGVTSGSFSIEHGGVSLAMAAVALRRVLVERAAGHLGCPPEEVTLDDGGAVSRSTGGRVPFTELTAAGPVSGTIEETDLPHWDAAPLGAAVPRDDLRDKLTGAPAYVQDLAPEGVLHARAFLPPSYQAEPEGLDLDAVRRLPGVQHVLQDGRLVIVIAQREDQALRAHRRLSGDVRWKRTEPVVDEDIATLLRSLPAVEFRVRDDADVPALLDSLPGHQASYFKPYQAHGPMGPSAAVALDQGGILKVWTHSQGIYPLRRELAALLETSEDRIVVQHSDGPGCYGMNGADDAAALAAIAARAVPGQPVRLQLSIADEFAWEPYGPAMIADLQAALDEEGTIRAWRHRVITDSHNTRPTGSGDRLLPAWLRAGGVERPWPGPGEPGARNAVPLYDLPALHVVADHVRGPLRTGPLRSLGSFFNVFASESFMDELAERAGRDPVAFRLAHLRDERARRVLEVAAEQAGWSSHVGPSGRGQGVALARYKDTKAYVAQVAEVEVDPDTGVIRITRIVIACDAGAIVNADGLRNQLEGGTLQGLSRTLYEELHVGAEGVQERDWTTYQVLRFSDVPRLEVTLIDRPEHPPIGAGEAATPPVPAAVANAIDDRIGIRLRELPLTPTRLERRLLEMDEQDMGRVRL